jgi:hypothetical protein
MAAPTKNGLDNYALTREYIAASGELPAWRLRGSTGFDPWNLIRVIPAQEV